MTWSYVPSLPTARDRVRQALGDTDTTNQLRSDEAIDTLVTAYGEAGATAMLAQGLANQYAQEPDSIRIGELSISWRERIGAWAALAAGQRTLAGSLSVSVDAEREQDTPAEYVREAWFTP